MDQKRPTPRPLTPGERSLRRGVLLFCAAALMLSAGCIPCIWLTGQIAAEREAEIERLLISAGGAAAVEGAVLPADSSDRPAGEQIGPQDEGARDLAALRAANPDFQALLVIPGAGLQFPVVQAADNSYYLSHNFKGEPSRRGAIFIDYLCAISPPGENTTIYGHHLRGLPSAQFGALLQYKGRAFFDDARVIELRTSDGSLTFSVYSVYVTSADFEYRRFSFFGEEDKLAFLRETQARSLFPTDSALAASDRILTLSTCDYAFDNARFVVQAVLTGGEEGI